MKLFSILSFLLFLSFSRFSKEEENINFVSKFLNLKLKDIPKTYYLNKLIEGFLQADSPSYKLSEFCSNVSIDQMVEGLLINACKHLIKCRNVNELNRTLHIICQSLNSIIKMTVKGCDLLENYKESKEIKKSAFEYLKKIQGGLIEISKSNGSIEEKLQKLGSLFANIWRFIEKDGNFLLNNINV